MYMLAENYVHPSHAKNTQTMYISQYAVNTKSCFQVWPVFVQLTADEIPTSDAVHPMLL